MEAGAIYQRIPVNLMEINCSYITSLNRYLVPARLFYRFFCANVAGNDNEPTVSENHACVVLAESGTLLQSLQ